MSARRRRKHEEPEEHENEERWMASYMDMVTVLMCMFIVLFAMSTVDQKGDTTDLQLAQQEAQNLERIRDAIQAALTRDGVQDAVQMKIDERGLTIGLVGSSTFFDSNHAELSPTAVRVLDDIGPVIAPEAYQVSVEGHADLRQPGAPYPTNWELSAGRATSVLRHLVESDGFPAERIAAVSFGSARPLANATGVTDVDLAQNRRVDVVVLSSQPERIRQLLPQALQPGTAPAGTATGG